MKNKKNIFKQEFNGTLLLSAVLLWGLLFSFFRVFNFNSVVINIIGFSFLLLVPGILTYLILKFPKDLSLMGKFALVVGISLLELIVVVLASNSILPHFGVLRPLDPAPLAAVITILISSLLVISWKRIADWKIGFKTISVNNFKGIDWFASLFPFIFVAMSVMGAVSLNNGGSNVVTICMIAGIAVYFIWLISQSNNLKDEAISFSIYIIGLSLLLMTSLRGWYTTGHDIQREYYVFMLAKNNGIWNINSYQDAYNACLSITLFPTILTNLLKLSDVYIFKVFFQLIFAITPTLIFLSMRRYLEKSLAIIASIWFMAFPAYFTDMPMLNRQEIAFLYLALMVWVAFEPKLNNLTKKVVFTFFGTSIIMLHYSTMYSVLIIVFFSIILRWCLPVVKSILKSRDIFKQSSIKELQNKNQNTLLSKPVLTFPVLFILVVASIVWVGIFTKTSAHVGSVFSQTILNIPNFFDKDTRSGQASYNLFSWKKINKQERLKEYVNSVVMPERKRSKPDIYSTDKHIYSVIEEKGNLFNFVYRQVIAKVTQLLIIVGFVYLIFRRKYLLNKKMDAEFVLLGIGSLLFVFLLLVLPVLSAQYGLLRAFQQTLMILSIFLVIGSLLIAVGVPEKIKIAFASFLVVGFFLLTTGFVMHFLSKDNSELHLNNHGKYYDLYYLHRSEIIASKWLTDYAKMEPDKIQYDDFTMNKIMPYTDFKNLEVLDTIYPSLIEKDSFVFIGPQTLRRQSSLSYRGDHINYVYPIDFIRREKDKLYSSGDVEVYK